MRQCCVAHSGSVKTSVARRFQYALRLFSVLATCPAGRSNAVFGWAQLSLLLCYSILNNTLIYYKYFRKPSLYYVVHTLEDFAETLRNSVLGRLDYQSLCSYCSVILTE